MSGKSWLAEEKRAQLQEMVRLIDRAMNVSDKIDEGKIGALLSHALAIAEARLQQLRGPLEHKGAD